MPKLNEFMERSGRREPQSVGSATQLERIDNGKGETTLEVSGVCKALHKKSK